MACECNLTREKLDSVPYHRQALHSRSNMFEIAVEILYLLACDNLLLPENNAQFHTPSVSGRLGEP